MKILVDENIPLVTVYALRQNGHDVKDIRGTEAEGMPDSDLWKIAEQEGRLLISTDKGFVNYRNEIHHGIIVVLLKRPNTRSIYERIMKVITQYSDAAWKNMLVVIRDTIQSTWKK